MLAFTVQRLPSCKPQATRISSLIPCRLGKELRPVIDRIESKRGKGGLCQPMLKASKLASRSQIATFAAMAQSYTGPQSQAISRSVEPCQQFALAAAEEPGDRFWRASTWMRCCRKLEDALHPSKLQVVNESHLHAGHMGNPDGAADAETHFRHVILRFA